MSTILITGGGRGIGYELAKQLVRLPVSEVALVLVTARGPSKLLDGLVAASAGRVLRFHCEATDQQSVEAFAAELDTKLAGRGVDILVNNIGVMPITEGGMHALDAAELLSTFDINVVSAHRMTVAMIPLLQKGSGKKIANVSTPLGSIEYASRYTWLSTPAYKWLKTDMGSKDADLDVDTGVNALKNLILSTKEDANGKFFNIHVPGWEDAKGPNQYNGAEIPW
ncbi:NAD(P)-binding domain protein [Akanthomyces lecanii RCEF 1005]|uniref:NAD(P)-binding domain protein n=1 Tax=Akanthomyces lecanii RCEF 1005 TaxID=1081108 RepID=A0A168C4P4_CORDF|nr:NAD(P)-binding domain protein [Akanthomyces lecanii RCEF 1005]